MESQPQNAEFRNNPENFHPCANGISTKILCAWVKVQNFQNPAFQFQILKLA